MSCSSSEDENVELLKEAQDNQFLKDCMFSGKQEKLNSAIEKTVSLRKTTDDDDYNIFKVTAEFRDYVAKNLSLLLEKNLKRNLEYIASDEVTKKRRKHGGIKLFSNSDKCLKLEIETVEKVPSSKTRSVLQDPKQQ
ncbi:hypothetical protein JTB14_011833 [Gonioctena quinquepunctata]|nr:hypothetical protein JTB14_011833 [Gonioctena quinquepunctata]